MAEKPSTLFLVIVAGLGSAILAPLNVSGESVVVLILPFALLAYYLYNAEAGIVVGIGASILATILSNRFDVWDVVLYGLSAGITVYALETIYPKQKNTLYALLFAALGTLLFDVLHTIYVGNSIFLRPERFLGSTPVLGIQILVNVFLTAGLLSYYETTSSPAKK